jgi:Rhodanese-related sulfurtransferase
MTQEINAVDAAKLREGDSNVVFLDVREDEELAICRIEGALHISMGTIPEKFEQLPRDKTLIVLCHHGMRSMNVVHYLEAQGFQNAVNLSGGIHAWSVFVDPEMAQY